MKTFASVSILTNVCGLCDGHQEPPLAAGGRLPAGEADLPSVGHQPPLVEAAAAAGLEGGGDPGGPVHPAGGLHTLPRGAGIGLEDGGGGGMEGRVVGTARAVHVTHFSRGNASTS